VANAAAIKPALAGASAELFHKTHPVGPENAKLVRRCDIEKDNGKQCPLGIPALEDKLVQLACAKASTQVGSDGSPTRLRSTPCSMR
jgi:hypothetical protein